MRTFLAWPCCSNTIQALKHHDPFIPPRAAIAPSAKLDHYIHAAERACLGRTVTPSPVFAHATTAPTLRNDRPNKVIVYGGRFSPPHIGHMSLLCHAFAVTDDTVIAAMIVPLHPVTNNTTLKLSKAYRKVLWQHDVLGRFAWVFQDPTPCTGDRRLTRNDEHNRVSRLIQDMKRQAKRDGYNL